MRFIIKQIILINFLIFFTSSALAEERFCLDKEGFIYPLFDEVECNEKSEENINKKEFSFLIEFASSERVSKLQEYRENTDKIESDLKEKLAGDLKEIDDKALLEKRKKEAEQKKIAKLAKEQKSAQDIDLKQKKKKEELKKNN